ncbi:NlpC/P60 family protein [Roseburia hominis]
MKKNTIVRCMCVLSAAAVLAGDISAVPVNAAAEQKYVIYQGERILVTVEGEYVILPNKEKILIKEFKGQFVNESEKDAPQPDKKTEDVKPVSTEEQKAPDPVVPDNTKESEEQPAPDQKDENAEQTAPDEKDGSMEETTPDEKDENAGETTPDEKDENVGETTPDEKDENAGETTPDEKDENAGKPTPDEKDENAGETTPAEKDENAGEAAPDEKDENAGQVPSDKTEGNGGHDQAMSGEPEQKDENLAENENHRQEKIKEESIANQTKPENLVILKPTVTAGIDFYIDELEEEYHLTFAEEFADVVADIEKEFIANVKKMQENVLLQMPEADLPESLEDEELGFANWQDVLAIYLLKEKKAGKDEFHMDKEAKEGLSAIFNYMNTGKLEENKATITSKTISDYMTEHASELAEEDRDFLEKYTSSNCTLLCAAATGIRGFIAESLGEDVSRERVQVLEAAYMLLGKIPYFWGGKSSAIGWDDRWGSPKRVEAAGVLDTGSIRNYGLDCSGFVTWAFINGYQDQKASSAIGHGTAMQWSHSLAIQEDEAKPGDLVFLQSPGTKGINHVGIVAGRNDDGGLIAIHCNAGDNGVVVESAYRAGFRYVRRPTIYKEELQ